MSHKNLGPIGSAVLTFIGYKQTDRQAKFTYRLCSIIYFLMKANIFLCVENCDLTMFLDKLKLNLKDSNFCLVCLV